MLDGDASRWGVNFTTFNMNLLSYYTCMYIYIFFIILIKEIHVLLVIYLYIYYYYLNNTAVYVLYLVFVIV